MTGAAGSPAVVGIDFLVTGLPLFFPRDTGSGTELLITALGFTVGPPCFDNHFANGPEAAAAAAGGSSTLASLLFTLQGKAVMIPGFKGDEFLI